MNIFRKFPDTLTIVLSILYFFVILTWVVPAGEFQRAEGPGGRIVIVPGSFEWVEAKPQGIGAFLTAPLKGFIDAAAIIGFVFFVGGVFSIINHTGAIRAGLASVIRFSMNKPGYKILVIPVVMTLFSIAGATFGMAEEVLVFIMITIPLAFALGYDSIVGVAIPFVGSGAGFAGAFANPFTIGIAQPIAELTLFSGMEYRILVWLVFTFIAIAFVMWYARRIEKKKEKSYVYEIDKKRDASEFGLENLDLSLDNRRLIILLLLLLTIVFLIVGGIVWGWYIVEMSALFIALGIATAAVYRLTLRESFAAFEEGARDMLIAAIIIGISRGMLVVATEGKIIDTILYAIASSTEGFHAAVSVQFMFIFQSVMNFFIPSGSGQAALTMPLMAPLSDLLGISRQTAVLAYQLGDGISNLVIPTSGVTMGILAIARIPYDRWLKFILPLIIIMSLVAMLMLIPPVVFFDWQ